MKKVTVVLAALFMIIFIAACSSNKTPSFNNTPAPSSKSTPKSDSLIDTSGQGDAKSSNILIVYFTMPEDINLEGVDAIASASIVVKDEKVLGNTEYIAQVIQQTAGGDLFPIETVQQYPLDHDPLVDQAADEQKKNVRPELSDDVSNLDDYDIIFLGYPNWWGDLPMPLYTFLEEHDLSGKTIIPFCPHGGSGFSSTVSTISEMQSNAVVSNDGFTISRNDVADSEAEVIEWIKKLNILK